VKTLVVPDVHVPFHSRKAVRKLLEVLHKEGPEQVVFLGDVCDFHALTVHRQQPDWQDNLVKECKAVEKFLDKVRAAAPNSDITIIEGNHEDRWNRMVQGRIPAMRLLGVDWDKFVGCDKNFIHVARRPVIIPCGQGQRVQLLHGHEVKGTSKLPSGHALKIAEKSGMNTHIGHTHRFGLTSTFVGGKQLFAIEGGFLADWRSSAFSYAGSGIARPHWVQMLSLYDAEDHTSPFPKFITA